MTEHGADELAGTIDYTKWITELRTALTQTLNGVYLRGSRAVPVCTHTGGGSLVKDGTQRISNSAGRVTGWAFNVPVGSAGPAQVDLYDGTDNTGTLLASVSVEVGKTCPFQHHGIAFVYGCYADITGAGADALRGAVYLGATE